MNTIQISWGPQGRTIEVNATLAEARARWQSLEAREVSLTPSQLQELAAYREALLGHRGRVYRGGGGQFCFQIILDGEPLSGGGGYDNQNEAVAGCLEVMDGLGIHRPQIAFVGAI